MSLDRIAAKFGVTRDQVWKHWKGLSPEYRAGLVADVPREELINRAVEESASLLDHFRLHRATVEQQLLIAKACDDSHAVSSLARTAAKINEQIGKLTGEIRELPKVLINNTNTQQINLLDSAPFRALENGLIEIAAKHPEAKSDIAALFHRLRDTSPSAHMIEAGAAHVA
ncbi:hypothetical protein [Labrys miyagiensis]